MVSRVAMNGREFWITARPYSTGTPATASVTTATRYRGLSDLSEIKLPV